MLAIRLTDLRFGTSNGFSALNWMLLPREVLLPKQPSKHRETSALGMPLRRT